MGKLRRILLLSIPLDGLLVDALTCVILFQQSRSCSEEQGVHTVGESRVVLTLIEQGSSVNLCSSHTQVGCEQGATDLHSLSARFEYAINKSVESDCSRPASHFIASHHNVLLQSPGT